MDQIGCPSCGKQFQINPSYYGKSFQCQCGQTVNVPQPGMAPPPPPPPPQAGYAPQPGYGQAQGYGTQPAGTPAIVIIGFICVWFCAPVGLILCAIGQGEAKRRGAGTGLATAGIVLGIIFTILNIIYLAALAG